MERRFITPWHIARKNRSSAVMTHPVDINRIDAVKANVPANAEAYQRQLNMLMYRLGT